MVAGPDLPTSYFAPVQRVSSPVVFPGNQDSRALKETFVWTAADIGWDEENPTTAFRFHVLRD